MILGIDVGGTHTDAVLVENFQLIKKAKVLTNHTISWPRFWKRLRSCFRQ